MNFSNKVVIVTGAGSGIGKAIAIRFAKLSANLTLVSTNLERLNKVAEECKHFNKAKILTLAYDLRNNENINSVVNYTIIEFGKIDVLVNCAGIVGNQYIISEDLLEVLDDVLNVNLPPTNDQDDKIYDLILSKFKASSQLHYSVFCEDNMKKHKDNKKQLNAELTLYKKITKTNKKLQELVKNFKQIENTYKHFKTTDSDSSESEIDEVFRKISYNKNKSKKLFQKQTFTTSDPSYHYRGTAYIYEYQESSVLGDEDAKDVKKELVNSKEEKTLLEDSLENNAKTEISSEKIAASDGIKSKTQSDEVVEIKIEAEKNLESLGFKPKKLLKKNKRQSFPNNRHKTRFSVLQSGKNNINVKRNNSEIPFKIQNQRIVYSELFPPETIWHEIINRPIKLNRVMVSEETSQLNSRGNKEETAMIRIDKTRKLEKEEDTTKILDGLGSRQELSDIAKDGNSTLREYGDECIQVPMKKCKKAMKAVNKNVCKRRFKCKSEFKSDFDKNLKKECVKKFSYIYSESKETNINRVIKDDNQFLDATRLRPPPTVLSLQNQSKISSVQLSLRDKFEKRCQKESRDKCIAACNDGTEATCLKHTCDKKKNKAMTRVCKEECKNIFLIDNKSSKSSDDSSDSDSESD